MYKAKKVGTVSNKSNLSQVVIKVMETSRLSMNDFLVIHHGQLDKKILCQVADIVYKEKKGTAKLLAILNILQTIPNPFKPTLSVWRAQNGIVAKALHIEAQPNHIHIGSLLGHKIDIYIDPNSLILKHFSLLGMTGSGKTYTVGVIIEELIKLGVTAVVVDPHEDYIYMKYFYPDNIVVRNLDDNSMSDCMNVEKLYNRGKITILNMRSIDKDYLPIYMVDIGWTLFRNAKAGNIRPFLFIVDECHNFAPQKHKVESSEIMATISAEGRKFGMGLCAITQRPAKINKDVISQSNTQIILKVSNPNDVKAVMTSVEGIRKEDAKKIQALESGTGQALIIGSNIKMPQYIQIKKKKCGEKEGKKVI